MPKTKGGGFIIDDSDAKKLEASYKAAAKKTEDAKKSTVKK